MRRPSNHLVTAIIETNGNQRECMTPPPNLSLNNSNENQPENNENEDIVALADDKSPPNTAPLPTKFGGLARPPPPPQNLLRIQLQKKSLLDCDSSSQNSTNAEATPKTGSKNLKLGLPLKYSSNSQDDSSSSDQGTPQKLSHITVQAQANKPKAPLLGRKSKRFLQAASNTQESESCSTSAMSSLESVRSSSAQSLISSSESGAGMSTSSNSNLSIPQLHSKLLLTRSSVLAQSKFQVLSPISDKSQEDNSSSKTPKVSPTDHILTSCCGGMATLEDDSVNNNEQSPAPFDMPKLQRRMIQQKLRHEQQYYQSRLCKRASNNNENANSNIQGSDSGISMSSQDVQDMVELLKLPFDMPKLRRKTQHILRPQSLPQPQTTSTSAVRNETFQRLSFVQPHQPAEATEPHPEAWPGPKPSSCTGSTIGQADNFKFRLLDGQNLNKVDKKLTLPGNSAENVSAENSVGGSNTELPAPPPGFADDNNQFYLTEDQNMDSTGNFLSSFFSFLSMRS